MAELIQDVRFALRMLRRGWGVTLVAIVSLSVAIGGNTAVFGLINALLFSPLSVTEPDRVLLVQERRREQPEGLSTLTTSLPTHADISERSRTTDGWAAFRPTVLGLRDGDRSEAITSARITTNFFEVIGVGVQRGRAFLAEEGVPGGRRVALVTPEFWERTRGGVGDPIGEILRLDGEPTEIVGVMPAEFSFVFTNADIWVPLTESPAEASRDRRDLLSIARLAPSATMDQARKEISQIAVQLESEFPSVQTDWTVDVFNVRTDIPDSRSKIFYGLLQGSVFFVLLIACANITNLLLARGQARRREIALRTVLGAGKGRLVRQLLTESGLLVLSGAALGLGLGWLGITALANYFASVLPPSFTPTLDGTVVLFTLGVSVLAGLFFGLTPILQTLRASQSEVLKEGAGRSSAGRSRKLISRSLVVVEIALSLIALGGGGMLIRSFMELRASDPGFDGTPLVTARVRVPDSRYPDEQQRLALLDQLLERTGAIEGIEVAALTNALPRNFQTPTDTFAIRGREPNPSAVAPRAFSLRTSPDYAEAFGLQVVRGRFFEDSDRLDQIPVAVVNQSFAERWFPSEDPVGQHLEFEGDSRQIVGVVTDIQQVIFPTPGQVESEAIYLPIAQEPMGPITIVGAAAGDPALAKEPLRSTLTELDPDLTLSQVLTMDEFVEQFFVGIRVFNTILGGFGVLAILLASLGTYGVLAYQVSQRRHEIGIRMAIGARGPQVLRMVSLQGIWMSVLGLGLGGLVLVPLTQLLRSILEGFTTVRGDTGVLVAAVLFTVTLAASLVPAYRASALDPVRALRDE